MFYMFDYFMKGFKLKDSVSLTIGRGGLSLGKPSPNFFYTSYCLYLTVRLNEASVSIGECFAFGFKLRNNLKDVDRILPTPNTSTRRGYYRISIVYSAFTVDDERFRFSKKYFSETLPMHTLGIGHGVPEILRSSVCSTRM